MADDISCASQLRKQQHPLAALKLGMQVMAHVNIKMQMRDRALATYKEHGILFYKALHELVRPGEILNQIGRMLENIEKKNPKIKRPGRRFFK